MIKRTSLFLPMLATTLFAQTAGHNSRALLERTLTERSDMRNGGDVTAFKKWSDQHLLDNFNCVMPNGTLANKDSLQGGQVRAMSAGGFHEQVSDTSLRMVNDQTAIVTQVVETMAKSTSGQLSTSRL